MRPTSAPRLGLTDLSVERCTLIAGLHAMREWPLADLLAYIDERGSERARLLASVTLAELLHPDADKLIELGQLRALAESSSGQLFEMLALGVLLEVYPLPVKRAYLMQRLGGPRWKLQTAMQRLAAQGKVTMFGNTSARCYTALLAEEVSSAN